MAGTIAKTDLPTDPKELRAALNPMLKPLVDASQKLGLVCQYANKEAPLVLPDTIDTSVIGSGERRVRCFWRSRGASAQARP